MSKQTSEKKRNILKSNLPVARCLGCGCTDFNACVSEADLIEPQACHWVLVDYKLGAGICSVCYSLLLNLKKPLVELFR